MKALNKQQVEVISGGFSSMLYRFAVPSVLNMIAYTVNKMYHNQNIHSEGLVIAAATGIGVGGLLGATGNNIENVVFVVGGTVVSIAGQIIARNY